MNSWIAPQASSELKGDELMGQLVNFIGAAAAQPGGWEGSGWPYQLWQFGHTTRSFEIDLFIQQDRSSLRVLNLAPLAEIAATAR